MPFILDMKTVFVLLALGHLFTVLLITAYRHRQAKDTAVNTFYVAKWFQSATWGILAIPGLAFQMAFLSLANSIFLCGVALETMALLKVTGGYGGRSRRYYYLLMLISVGAYNLVVLFHNAEVLRISIVSLSIAAFLFPPVFRMIGSKERSTLSVLVGYMYFIVAAGLLVRTVMSWFSTGEVTMFEPNLYRNLSFLCLYLIMTLGNTGFVLLSKEKADMELLKLASYDDLTGALNRRTFILEAKRHLDANEKKQRPVSFILLDLDDFKLINDTYGHDVGDEVLRNFTAKVRGKLGEGGLLGRYGGDEFAILLPGADEVMSDEMAQALKLAVEQNERGGQGVEYTISMGVITVIPGSGILLEHLYKLADQALYLAKEEGRNRVARNRVEGIQGV
ncbi:GGDEF domain-containing protein [Fontibacillus sp. BL9]|uniref:GGDEF domain-containing protein n=1 Tax=Fontibacillus sp. BL9 TaxID=3389971 RepID=UPI00397ABA0A